MFCVNLLFGDNDTDMKVGNLVLLLLLIPMPMLLDMIYVRVVLIEMHIPIAQ